MKFALLFDGRALESWHLRCLEALRASAELVGVVVSPMTGGRPASASSTRLRRWYARRHARREIVDVRERFAGIDRLSLDERHGRGAVDFVLKLGPGPLPDGVEALARHGLWHFEHETPGFDLPFLRQAGEGKDVTIARLLALRAGSARPLLLQEGRLRTEKRSYSRQRCQVEAALAPWPAHICRRISAVGFERCAGELVDCPPEDGRMGDVEIVLRLASRKMRFAWRRLFRHPQWNVGVLRQPAGQVVDEGRCRDERIDWFPLLGRRSFLADPFGVRRDGALGILCERYEYRRGKGWIAALEWREGRFRWVDTHVLERECHLSYPCLFEHEGKTYCIPEGCQAGEIALYRAEAFPGPWVRVSTLLPGVAGVDPTVFRHEGRWWLFCTLRGGESDAALWCWHAADVLGPWVPHALNPVKIDVSGSRPGGAVFVHDGRLYRPAQDCSRHYGWRVVIQRVDRLTPTDFSEAPACIVQAGAGGAYPLGRHTFTALGDVVLVDGHREVFSWHSFCHILGIWLREVRRKLFGAVPR